MWLTCFVKCNLIEFILHKTFLKIVHNQCLSLDLGAINKYHITILIFNICIWFHMQLISMMHCFCKISDFYNKPLWDNFEISPLSTLTCSFFGGLGGSPNLFFFFGILMFLLLRSPCKISKLYDKPLCRHNKSPHIFWRKNEQI